MKIRPVGPQLFHADGRLDRQAGQSEESVIADRIALLEDSNRLGYDVLL